MGALRPKIKITFWVFYLWPSPPRNLSPGGIFQQRRNPVECLQFLGTRRVLWVLGITGAFLTAFYSFRLINLTFRGKSRIDPEVAHHVHESPKVMTIPLIILAFFSVTIGWIGMPGALIPHSNLFGDFLAPVFPAAKHAAEGTHGLERWLMIFSVFVALAGIRLAYSLYVKHTAWPERIAKG